jgi:hypothetical protein
MREGWLPSADRRTSIRDKVEARALQTEDSHELVEMVRLALQMDRLNLDAVKLEVAISGLAAQRASEAAAAPLNEARPRRVIFDIPDNGRGPNGYANPGSNDHDSSYVADLAG